MNLIKQIEYSSLNRLINEYQANYILIIIYITRIIVILDIEITNH